MATRAQSQAFRKGTLAAIERKKERVTTIFEIEHSPQINSQKLLQAVQHTFAMSGVVNLSNTSIHLGEGSAELQMALQQTNEMVEHYRALYEQAQQQLDTINRADPREWISLTKLSEQQNVCYSTIWRAYNDGRLVTKVTGGVKKNQLMCDPLTYVPTNRKLAKSKK